MKKKLLSILLSTMLLLNCFVFTAKAETTVNVSFDSAVAAMNRMCEYLEGQDVSERAKLFKLVHSYVITDTGMNSLVGIVEGTTQPGDLSGLFGALGAEDPEQKDALTFLLRLVKCIPEQVREESFEILAEKTALPSGMGEAEEQAFKDLCSTFVSDSFIEIAGTQHAWTPSVIYNFVTTITSVVTLTDSVENPSDFAVKAVSPEFAAKIEAEFAQDAPVINGTPFTSADDLVNSLVETVNESTVFTDELKEQTKDVIENTDVDNYTPYVPSIVNLFINTPENLVQRGTMQPVEFRATYYPVEGDASSIVWFVDDVQQTVTGASFTYTPTEYGKYEVYAKATAADGTVAKTDKRTVQIVANSVGPTPTPTLTPSTPDYTFNTPTPTPVTPPPSGLDEIPAPPSVAESSFVDAKDHWAKDYLESLANQGIFAGDGDGTIRPDDNVTREEMAMLLVRILGVEDRMSTGMKHYTDHTDIASYAKEAVYVLSDMEVYMGYDDGAFRPKQVLTREEIMTLFDRLLGDIDAKTLLFTDTGNIADWAYHGAEQMYAYGIIDGYPDGSLKPGNNVTRAEAAVMIYKLMYRSGKLA